MSVLCFACLLFSISSIYGQQGCEIDQLCIFEISDCASIIEGLIETETDPTDLFSECASQGVECSPFAQICVIDGEGQYGCHDVQNPGCQLALEECGDCPNGITQPPAITTAPPFIEDTEPPFIEDTEPPFIEDTEPPFIEDTEPPFIEDTEPPFIEDTDPPFIEDTDPPFIEDTDPPFIEDTEPPFMKKTSKRPGPRPIGKRGRDWHAYCCKWAYEGECDKRIYFMRTVCQKSCGTIGCRFENAKSCKVKVNVKRATCLLIGKPDYPVPTTGGSFVPRPSLPASKLIQPAKTYPVLPRPQMYPMAKPSYYPRHKSYSVYQPKPIFGKPYGSFDSVQAYKPRGLGFRFSK